MEEKREKLSKKWFIFEIAKRARFTQSDVKIIIDTIEDVLKDVIRDRATFVWAGMFKLTTRVMLEHKGHNAAKNKPIIIPDKERVTFVPSRLWKTVLEEDDEKE